MYLDVHLECMANGILKILAVIRCKRSGPAWRFGRLRPDPCLNLSKCEWMPDPLPGAIRPGRRDRAGRWIGACPGDGYRRKRIHVGCILPFQCLRASRVFRISGSGDGRRSENGRCSGRMAVLSARSAPARRPPPFFPFSACLTGRNPDPQVRYCRSKIISPISPKGRKA